MMKLPSPLLFCWHLCLSFFCWVQTLQFSQVLCAVSAISPRCTWRIFSVCTLFIDRQFSNLATLCICFSRMSYFNAVLVFIYLFPVITPLHYDLGNGQHWNRRASWTKTHVVRLCRVYRRMDVVRGVTLVYRPMLQSCRRCAMLTRSQLSSEELSLCPQMWTWGWKFHRYEQSTSKLICQDGPSTGIRVGAWTLSICRTARRNSTRRDSTIACDVVGWCGRF